LRRGAGGGLTLSPKAAAAPLAILVD
jgi:hypothetical protein